MDDSAILEELVAVLEEYGVSVRREEMGGSGGGLCLMGAEQVCFVDTDARICDNAANCAEAVCKLVDIEYIYLRPAVREFLSKFGICQKF